LRCQSFGSRVYGAGGGESSFAVVRTISLLCTISLRWSLPLGRAAACQHMVPSWPGAFCVQAGHAPRCFCKTAEADGKQEASCPLAADNFGQCLGQSRFARLYVHTHRRLQRCPLGSALDWPDDNYGGCQLEGLDEGRRGVSEVGHGVWGWANGMTTLIVSTNAGNSRAGPGNAPLLCPLYGGEWSGVPLMCHNQVKSRRREHVRGHCGEWDERHIDTQRCDGRLAGGAGAFGRWRGS
jgi:hypothetical protein